MNFLKGFIFSSLFISSLTLTSCQHDSERTYKEYFNNQLILQKEKYNLDLLTSVEPQIKDASVSKDVYDFWNYKWLIDEPYFTMPQGITEFDFWFYSDKLWDSYDQYLDAYKNNLHVKTENQKRVQYKPFADVTENFADTKAKLYDRTQTVKLVIFGDSITCGTGEKERFSYYLDEALNVFFAEQETDCYKDRITVENDGIGGATAVPRKDDSKNKICLLYQWDNSSQNADFYLIAFGDNDSNCSGMTVEKFLKNIRVAIDEIRSVNSNAEILLVSPIPHRFSTAWMLPLMENGLNEIAEEDSKIGLLPLHALTYDLWNNKEWLNYHVDWGHPNKYFHKLYASYIMYCILGDDFESLN